MSIIILNFNSCRENFMWQNEKNDKDNIDKNEKMKIALLQGIRNFIFLLYPTTTKRIMISILY